MAKSEIKKPVGIEADIAALNKLILRSIVDHAVVTMDANGIVTSWNEGAEQILGWKEEEIIGQSADVFFTSEDAKGSRPEKEMAIAIQEGRAEDVRWHVRKNGEQFWGSGLMMPLLKGTDADGTAIQAPERIEGYVKIFRDRTVEREADQRMARLQDRATLAMQRSGTVGVFDIDLKNDVVGADHVCARMHSVDVKVAEGGSRTEIFFEGIVKEDQDKARAAFEVALAEGKDADVIYRVKSDSDRPKWIHAQGRIHSGDNDAPLRLTGIVVDITEQQEHLRMQEARLIFAERLREMKNADEIARMAAKVIGETIYASRVGHGYVAPDGDTIDIRADWNASGGESLVGKLRFSDFGEYAQVLRNGEEVVITDVVKDDRVSDTAALDDIGVGALVNLPLIEDGRLKAVLFVNDNGPRDWSKAELTFLGAMFDRTYAAIDLLAYERERDILSDEITHRMKNVLSIAQVIVKQSLRKATDFDEATVAINSRLLALSGAQDVLSKADERDADILSVVETTLAPHLPQQGRIVFTGPSIPLNSDQVLGLSLALHELATNAAKYGALSNATGTVALEWSADEKGQFSLDWTEADGPPVSTSEEKGFGTSILGSIVASYFSGESNLAFDQAGVRFSLRGTL